MPSPNVKHWAPSHVAAPHGTERNDPGHWFWWSLPGSVMAIDGSGSLRTRRHLSQPRCAPSGLFPNVSASLIGKTRRRQPGAKCHAGEQRIQEHKRVIPRLSPGTVCRHGHHATCAQRRTCHCRKWHAPTTPCPHSKQYRSLVTIIQGSLGELMNPFPTRRAEKGGL